MAAGQVRVRVADGWSVFADGAQRSSGETVEVDPATAALWLARGWAVEAAEKANSTRRPSAGTVRRPVRPKAS